MKRARSTKEKGSAGAPPAVSGAPPGTSKTLPAKPPTDRAFRAEAGSRPRGRERQRAGAPALPESPQDRRFRRSLNPSADWRWVDPDSAIERKTGAIVPLWTAESIVNEAGQWLDVHLPEELPALLAAKAERCFAKHRQFHRLVCSNANGGNAGIAALRKFMRHWTCSWLKRRRPALFRRLPWSYALGIALRKERGPR